MSADFRLGRWEDVLPDVTCDALIVDAPYSARTHAAYGHIGVYDGSKRARIGYESWDREDVRKFCAHWSPRTRGWFVTITDHILSIEWCAALADQGRYVFTPLPLVETGGRVRMAGDGPSCWTCWVVAARPRNRAYARWGTLPGAYVTPRETRQIMGGKPLTLIRALVRDYSRPGDLVCDPCAGGATTLVAARAEGRSAVGSEMDETHYRLGRLRLSRGYTPPLFTEGRDPMVQLSLEAE